MANILKAGTRVVILDNSGKNGFYNLQKDITLGLVVPALCPKRSTMMLCTSPSPGFHVFFTQDQITNTAPVVTPTIPAPAPALQAAPRARNEHVGVIGERITTSLRVVRVGRPTQTDFGTRAVVSGLDAQGRTVQFWSSNFNSFTVGTTYHLRGTVTEHGEFRGWRQTTINRVVDRDSVETPAPVAHAAPVAVAPIAAATQVDGVEVVEQLGVSRAQVEAEQQARDDEFDRTHKAEIDNDEISKLRPYIFTYDIPSRLGAFSPVNRLRPLGYHLQGSVWVINEDSLPWSLIKYMRDMGCDVQYYRFDSDEARKLVRAAIRAILSDIEDAKATANALAADWDARMVARITTTGASDDEVLAAQRRAMNAATKRLEDLERDLSAACRRFGVQPASLRVETLRGTSESVRHEMVSRADAFVRALRRLRATGTVTGEALAAELEGRTTTTAVAAAADYLNEVEDGAGAEVADTFLGTNTSDQYEDHVFDLDGDDGEHQEE